MKVWYEVVVKTDPEDKAVAPDEGYAFHKSAVAMALDVFALGEILVVDADGREVDGLGRKSSKWGVTVERFDNLKGALARAREVRQSRDRSADGER